MAQDRKPVGWRGDPRGHREAYYKGREGKVVKRPTAAVKRASSGSKLYRPKVYAKNYSTPSEAWDAFSGYANPEDIIIESPGLTTYQIADDMLRDAQADDHFSKLDFSHSNALEQLVRYINQNVGSDKFRAVLDDPTLRGDQHVAHAAREWTKIFAVNQSSDDLRKKTYPTENDAIVYLEAHTFDPQAALKMWENMIYPGKASISTNRGHGGYWGTIGYKVSNGDLSIEEARKIAHKEISPDKYDKEG